MQHRFRNVTLISTMIKVFAVAVLSLSGNFAVASAAKPPVPPAPPGKARICDSTGSVTTPEASQNADPRRQGPCGVAATSTTVPCGTTVQGGGKSVTTTVHEMNQNSGYFEIHYSRTSPAQFDVYYEDNLIYSTNGPVYVSEIPEFAEVEYGDDPPGTATTVTVVVTGFDASTTWTYRVDCPQNLYYDS